ncbi:MAG: diguanylate cyclase [Gaiella sp.]
MGGLWVDDIVVGFDRWISPRLFTPALAGLAALLSLSTCILMVVAGDGSSLATGAVALAGIGTAVAGTAAVLGLVQTHRAHLLRAALTEHEQRDALRGEIADALDLAANEDATARIVADALARIDPTTPGELLLVDAGGERLQRVAANAKTGSAACPVTSPLDCVAMKRDSLQTFPSSESLSACPKLRGRAEGPMSGVCVPVRFMGSALGVLHATGPDGALPVQVGALQDLAQHTGARVGTLRMFEPPGERIGIDALTNLYDRAAAETAIRRLGLSGTPFALALADIDHLSNLNEEHGTESGDRVLQLFADVIRSYIRGSDIAARFGGEEFALLFPNTAAEDAARLLERIQFAVGGALATDETPSFTVSFGVADSDGDHGSGGVLHLAETALREAKETGRNRIVVFTDAV